MWGKGEWLRLGIRGRNKGGKRGKVQGWGMVMGVAKCILVSNTIPISDDVRVTLQ